MAFLGVMTVQLLAQGHACSRCRRFQENFKRSLMQFYGNALLEYNNQGIRVLPSSGRGLLERTSVNMEIVRSQGRGLPMSYTMVSQTASGRLRNVIINGINIGKLFRDQFADAMQRNGNDLDKTINRLGREAWPRPRKRPTKLPEASAMTQSAVRIGDAGESVPQRRAGLPHRPGLRKQGQALIKAAAQASAWCWIAQR